MIRGSCLSPSIGVRWMKLTIQKLQESKWTSSKNLPSFKLKPNPYHCRLNSSLSSLPQQLDDTGGSIEETSASQKKKTSKKGKWKSPPPKSNEGPFSFTPSQQNTFNYAKQNSSVTTEILKLIPPLYLKQTKTIPTSVYLVSSSVASQIETMIKSEILNLNSPVLELLPGIGLLTEKLVNNLGFKNVTCLEDNTKLGNSIKERFNVSVVNSSLDALPRYYHLDKHDGGDRIFNILSQIKVKSDQNENSKRETKDKPILNVIGVFPHVSAINFLIRCYATQRVLFDEHLGWSGTTFFIALGGKAELICKAKPTAGLVAYRATSVLFQTLFNIKELGSLPRDAFVPWEAPDKNRVGLRSRKLKEDQPHIMKFFKVEINKEMLQKVGKENLLCYWYFVRQCLYARTNKIIPELEKWVPGCGVRLIKQGYTIFSQFGVIEPEEILDLYLQFVSWPEFQNSSFLNAVEKFQTRLEIAEEEDE